MANAFAVTDLVAKEAQRVAHEKASFIPTVDRQYDSSFKQTGGKHGSTLRVKKPNAYTSTLARAAQVQDVSEETQTITVASQRHVAIALPSVDLVQSVDNGAQFDDLSRVYIEPAVSRLVSDIENQFLTFATQNTANLVGTAGSAINSISVPNLARARINQHLAPKGDRSTQIDSLTMATIVAGSAAYFNPSNAISEQYREGMVARTAMADFYENERVWTMPNAGDVAGTLDTFTLADGGTSITVTGFSAAPVAGMVFTMAGVFDVNEEGTTLPHLKQFTVVTGTTTTITFLPAIQTTGARKNASALPATTAAVAFVGAASTSYAQPLMYHKEAFQFITADLPLMAGADKCVRTMKDGLSMRVWMDGDIRNDELICRIDILYGFAALRPNWACRMIGSAIA